jgi:hypothetical protein
MMVGTWPAYNVPLGKSGSEQPIIAQAALTNHTCVLKDALEHTTQNNSIVGERKNL